MSRKAKTKPVDVLIKKQLDSLSKNLRKHRNKEVLLDKNKHSFRKKTINEYVSTLLDEIDKTSTVGERRTPEYKSTLMRELENTIAEDVRRRKLSENPVVVLKGSRPVILGAYGMPKAMRRELTMGKKTKKSKGKKKRSTYKRYRF